METNGKGLRPTTDLQRLTRPDMRGNNGTFHLYDERAKHRNAHMSNILSEENEWDQIVAVYTVDGPSVRVRKENKMGYSST